MQSGALRCTPLGLLCRCLSFDEQGNDDTLRTLTSPQVNWPKLLRTAGAQLVTPALASALKRRQILDQLDPEVRNYLDGIQSLNLIRNETLRTQLFRIAEELNGIGITPLLIKGAIALLPNHYPGATDRLMGDLDIVVPDEKMSDAHALLARMGYSEKPDAYLSYFWATAVEKRSVAHIPGMQHQSLPVSVELHRRMLSKKHDDKALQQSANLLSIALPSGATVMIPDPTAQLVHSFIHSQISHQLGPRRLIHMRHLLEFAALTQHYRDDIAIDTIRASVLPKRLSQLAEYWAVAESWLGALFPEGLQRSPRERPEKWLVERSMTDAKWRRAFEMSWRVRNYPSRLVKFGQRVWERQEYLPVRIRRLIAERR